MPGLDDALNQLLGMDQGAGLGMGQDRRAGSSQGVPQLPQQFQFQPQQPPPPMMPPTPMAMLLQAALNAAAARPTSFGIGGKPVDALDELKKLVQMMRANLAMNR